MSSVTTAMRELAAAPTIVPERGAAAAVTSRSQGVRAGGTGAPTRDVPRSPLLAAVAAVLAWVTVAGLTALSASTHAYSWPIVVAALTVAVAVPVGVVAGRAWPRLGARVANRLPLLTGAGLWLAAWVFLTANRGTLKPPYFPAPQGVVAVFVNDRQLLWDSTRASLKLLASGYLAGAMVGFVTGVLIGWSRLANYWITPVLKTIGPVPATAWIPLLFVVFPTGYQAAVFIIALSVWFPMTILTWSGISSVDRAYYDVAATLGAGRRRLIWRVAIPAALPSIFVGLFMALGSSFVTIVVAEMMGVDRGLGWYIRFAQGWAAYPKMYAAIVIMAVVFSTLIVALFKLRDRVLSWQKGLIRW